MPPGCALVCVDPHEQGKHHTFTEADWNVTAAPQRFPYFYSKKMAEQRAYEMHEEAGGRWSLCSINPGAIWGPPLSDRSDSESVQQIVGLLSGRMWPWYSLIGAGFVDVRDVAKAHIAAMVNPNASGRYLVNSRSCYMLDLASRVLRKEFPRRWVPPLYPPIALAAAVFGPLLGLPYDLAMAMQFKLPNIDASRAARDLGMTPDSYIPPEQSVRDMGHAVMARGIVPSFEVPRVPLVLLTAFVGVGLVAWLAVLGGFL
jgi:nucleoside-diphosphate-sugar epimerase